MKPTPFMFIFLALIFQVIGPSSFAETTALINYQGKLVQGKNLVTDDVSMTFRIYTDMTAGTCIYEEPMTVHVVDGYYSVLLGKTPVVGDIEQAASEDETYLEVSVNGNPLRPREKFTPPPFAKKSTEHWRTVVNGISLCSALRVVIDPWLTLGFGPQTAEFLPAAEDKTITAVRFRWTNGRQFCSIQGGYMGVSPDEYGWGVCNEGAGHHPPCYMRLEIHSLTSGVVRVVSSEPVDLTSVVQNKWLQIPLSSDAANRFISADDEKLVVIIDNGTFFSGWGGPFSTVAVDGDFYFDVEVK